MFCFAHGTRTYDILTYCIARSVFFFGQVLSKTKSVTPHLFYISDSTNSLSFNGKIIRKKINFGKFSRERS